MLNKNQISAMTMTSASRIILAAGLLIGATFVPTLVRADEVSFEGKIANTRLVGEVSSALSGYSRSVGALAQDLKGQDRAKAEDMAFNGYRRLEWYVSALQSSATAPEVDEFAELQQMIDVYHEMHEKIASDARSGNLAGAAHDAMMASAVVDQVRGSLHRIADRNFGDLYALAAEKDAAVRAAQADTAGQTKLAAAQ